MNTIILKGSPVSKSIKLSLKKKIDKLVNDGVIPTLVAVLVGDDPASEIYVNSKHKTFIKNNCKSKIQKFDKNITESELINFIRKMNSDKKVHGILIQLPLPENINERKVLNTISPDKDVDGFHPLNMGNLLLGYPNFIPCTPAGCLEILKYYSIEVQSKHVVVVGRSNIVGKPIMALLSQKFDIGNATVTICHTGTKNIEDYTKQADILIIAVGQPEYVTSNMIKKGVHILDVGINRVSDNSNKGYKIVGDVDYESVCLIANSITPVPGGVGPMTITMLLKNTVEAASQLTK
tara:strand:+ start:733 stop:1611 length:879 start_codon:yes stop_codon:yes gene_type:complete